MLRIFYYISHFKTVNKVNYSLMKRKFALVFVCDCVREKYIERKSKIHIPTCGIIIV